MPVLVGLRDLREPSRPRSVLRAFRSGTRLRLLAIWDSALAIPALAGAAAGLVAAGWRPRVRAIATFVGDSLPAPRSLVIARVIQASASSPVTALRPRWLWMAGLARSGARGERALRPAGAAGGGRAGARVAAGRGVLVLGAGLILLVAAAGRDRRAPPLLGWAAALAAGFAMSRRTGGDEVRYLYGLTVPVLALAGMGVARLGARASDFAAAAALAVSGPWLLGHRVVTAAWRNPEHASVVWQVPPLDPVLASLRRAGVASGYASLQFAARLSVESDEAVLASQAWNERIPGDPLRFRDEVDLDPRASWIPSSRLSRGMPRAGDSATSWVRSAAPGTRTWPRS